MPSEVNHESSRNDDSTTAGKEVLTQKQVTGYDSRAQQALQELMREISFGGSPSSFSLSSSSSVVAVEAFLMRNLIASDFSVADAVTQLRQRRVFEKRLTSLRVTSTVLAALRSGWVSIIGRDLQGRSVLCLNAYQFSLSPLGSDDVQRVFIMMMEYMLGHAALAQPSVSDLPRGRSQPLQQFTVLIAENRASWSASQSIIAHMSMISTVIIKYYPHLVGLVLLLDASSEVQRAVKQYIADNPEGANQVVQVIAKPDLATYMDPDLLPDDFYTEDANIKATATFADAVLRHWYVMTSYLLVEDVAGRPLWQLPPTIETAADWSSFQRHCYSPTMNISKTPPNTFTFPRQLAVPNGEATSFASSRRSCTFYTCQNMDDDDGLCSMISETDGHPYTCSSAKLSSRDVHLELVDPNDKLARELQNERELRKIAESQLMRMQLGVTLDPATATDLERALAVMHAEVNKLVSNIIVRANEAAQASAPPTFPQLLGLTLSALEAAGRRRERVPAMSLALPAHSLKERDSFCCGVM